MSAKAKKTGLSAFDLLKSRVPTVAERLQRIDRTIKFLTIAVHREDEDFEDIRIDPQDAKALLAILREADEEVFWLLQQPPRILKAPAPDDDERGALAGPGGVR
jgi:hypothetical protein